MCLVVAYGLGVDSTAMLVNFVRRGVKPAAILFADVGGEKEETYAYLPIMNAYLRENAFPEVTVVKNVVTDFKHWPPYHTLEENCLTNGTLPSVAFGFQMKSCSLKWKAAPQHKFLRSFKPAMDAWGRGEKVIRAIGFDSGPGDRRRANHAGSIRDPHYSFLYPLQIWGWDRGRCEEEIRKEGLPVPPKSSCFFCPAMKPAEVRALPADKLRRIVIMEARAEPRLRSIQGLWGNGCKGTRGSVKRPGRMSDFIVEEGLLKQEEVNDLRSRVPLELVANQAAHATGEYIPTWPEFFAASCGSAA